MNTFKRWIWLVLGVAMLTRACVLHRQDGETEQEAQVRVAASEQQAAMELQRYAAEHGQAPR